MALDLNQFREPVDEMAKALYQRHSAWRDEVTVALEIMHAFNVAWEYIEQTLAVARSQVNETVFRAALPLQSHDEPLDAAIRPERPPAEATVIAVDGSQIFPDPHSMRPYYLVNIGGVIYEHGSGQAPSRYCEPSLYYPNDAREENASSADEDDFTLSPEVVSVRRDIAEMETLAQLVCEGACASKPTLGILDQRLLYWPIGAKDEGRSIVDRWFEALAKVRDKGQLLAGYISRSGKSSVVRTLEILARSAAGEKWLTSEQDTKWQFSDAILFEELLGPGDRSRVFAEISWHNRHFQQFDADAEICFFYLNPGTPDGQIARVDIPAWIARDPSLVDLVHSLIYDQCRILQGYPYVLARADEEAVVTKSDKAELDGLIDRMMEREGVAPIYGGQFLPIAWGESSRRKHQL